MNTNITKKQAFEALYYIHTLELESKEDFLLYLISLKLLDEYDHHTHTFHQHIYTLAYYLAISDIDIQVDYDIFKDEIKFKVDDLIFIFDSVYYTPQIEALITYKKASIQDTESKDILRLFELYTPNKDIPFYTFDFNIFANRDIFPTRFMKTCRKIQSICVDLHSKEKEYIDESLAKEALIYLKTMYVHTPGDLLLYLASLNLLNTYVKQEHTITYRFKKHVQKAVSIVKEKNMKDVFVEKQENLTLFQIYDLQFSFHNGNKVETKEYQLKWDGIRKQHCAKTLYLLSRDNKHSRTYLTNPVCNLWKVVDEYKALNIEELNKMI